MSDDQQQNSTENPEHTPVRDIRDLLTFRIGILAATNSRIAHSWMYDTYGISVMEWRVLGLVMVLQPVPLGELAKDLYVDKSQLSRLIRSLSDQGFIQIKPDPEDNRVRIATTTPRGKVLHDQIFDEAYRRNEILVSSALTAEEVETFFKLLDRLQPLMNERAARFGVS